MSFDLRPFVDESKEILLYDIYWLGRWIGSRRTFRQAHLHCEFLAKQQKETKMETYDPFDYVKGKVDTPPFSPEERAKYERALLRVHPALYWRKPFGLDAASSAMHDASVGVIEKTLGAKGSVGDVVQVVMDDVLRPALTIPSDYIVVMTSFPPQRHNVTSGATLPWLHAIELNAMTTLEPHELVETLCHEMVHVDQNAHGRFGRSTPKTTIFDGKPYPNEGNVLAKSNVNGLFAAIAQFEYERLPWEADAIARAKGFTEQARAILLAKGILHAGPQDAK